MTSRVIVGLLGLGICLAGVLGLAEIAATRSITDLADFVEDGQPLTADFLDNHLDDLPWDWVDATCLTQRRRAAVTIRLAALDTRVIQLREGRLEPAAITPTLEAANDAIIGLLMCNPTDGNAWLRLALVRLAREGPNKNVIDAVERSYWYAPREVWILRPRDRLLAQIANAGIESDRIGDILDADALTMARGASLSQLRVFLREGGEAARQALGRTLPRVRWERQDLLRGVLAET